MQVVVVAKARPDRVLLVNPAPRMLTASAMAAVADIYQFYQVAGPITEGAPLPSVRTPYVPPESTIDADGYLHLPDEGGAMRVVGMVRGKDAVLPGTMGGFATTVSGGKAVLDWSALKLKAPPSWVDVAVIGKPLGWGFDADPTATGVTVSVREDKPGTGLNISLSVAGGQPAVGVRLAWRVWA